MSRGTKLAALMMVLLMPGPARAQAPTPAPAAAPNPAVAQIKDLNGQARKAFDNYSYRGARAPEDVEGFIYGMLSGL